MQIQITGRHGHLSEETQDRLKSKVEKLLRHYERLTSIEVVVDLQDVNKPKVDLLVSAEHKHDFVAHEQTNNLLTSIESAVHKIDQQLRKYKERTIENHRDPDAKRQAGQADDETSDEAE